MIVFLHLFVLFGEQNENFHIPFFNAWERFYPFQAGACCVLDVFSNSTVGPQCSREFL